VKYYTVIPDFFVPNAFSPNADGLNDMIRPLALGLRSVSSFCIFNRWGQLLFKTTQIGMGWDGKFKGNVQEAGTYVWFAEGIDFKNRKIERKGTIILIR
jgi:gliding motility-associated-like protein